VQLAEPDEYDPKYKKWRMADLPIVPDKFDLVVRDERSPQAVHGDQQAACPPPTSKRFINACDARPRGRADLRLDLREGRGEEAGAAAVAVLDGR